MTNLPKGNTSNVDKKRGNNVANLLVDTEKIKDEILALMHENNWEKIKLAKISNVLDISDKVIEKIFPEKIPKSRCSQISQPERYRNVTRTTLNNICGIVKKPPEFFIHNQDSHIPSQKGYFEGEIFGYYLDHNREKGKGTLWKGELISLELQKKKRGGKAHDSYKGTLLNSEGFTFTVEASRISHQHFSFHAIMKCDKDSNPPSFNASFFKMVPGDPNAKEGPKPEVIIGVWFGLDNLQNAATLYPFLLSKTKLKIRRIIECLECLALRTEKVENFPTGGSFMEFIDKE